MPLPPSDASLCPPDVRDLAKPGSPQIAKTAETIEHDQELRRELGFWDALTIGAGTMIGAGIFLLAGIAVDMAGPAAIFAYLFAGAVCMATAASAAELATGMPTSGGDYYFVSRSLGPALGAISGVGIWLSLTFAIAFYLYGLGQYLSLILPVTPLVGALAGGALLTGLNVVGARESGRTQVVIVLTLFAILGGLSLFGVFHMEAANLAPFFPFGAEPILATTALVFVSFLGFVKIAAVAEEIRDPARNLPRALIGSVALVTVLYVLIVLIIAGIFSQRTIGQVQDPLTAAARVIFGGPGGLAIILAGLLATTSSANASIMASSRINLAMARDRMVPKWLSAIHRKMLTPHRAILVTGLLALAFLLVESLEELAKIASSLQLYSYAALNVGCVMLRAARPPWYRPSFRTPGYPFVQLGAAAACLSIILYSGPFAQIAVGSLIVVSLLWYLIWGRSRVDIEHALPDLRANWTRLGPRAFFVPAVRGPAEEAGEPAVEERPLDARPPRRITVALAHPAHEASLLELGRLVAAGAERGGEVFGIHLVRVPLQTPLRVARERFSDRFSERADVEEMMARLAEEVERGGGEGASAGPLRDTRVEAVTDVAHDVFSGLVAETARRRADLLLMGWRGGFGRGRIRGSPVQRVMSHVRSDFALLKDRGLERFRSVGVPWGGGIHARLGLELALRIARGTGGRVELFRLVKPDADPEREKERMREAVRAIAGELDRVRIDVRPAASVQDGMRRWLDECDHQLVIIGASGESRLHDVLFGSIPDMVASMAPCSVLMVRRYVPRHWSVTLTDFVKRIGERLGLTTSPEAGEES